MENLTSAINKISLEELKNDSTDVKTFVIEPTEAEITAIVGALANGDDYKTIKKNIRRVIKNNGVQVSAQGFSLAQIEEIDKARKDKILELESKEE